jgi:hypothetical protein
MGKLEISEEGGILHRRRITNPIKICFASAGLVKILAACSFGEGCLRQT